MSTGTAGYYVTLVKIDLNQMLMHLLPSVSTQARLTSGTEFFRELRWWLLVGVAVGIDPTAGAPVTHERTRTKSVLCKRDGTSPASIQSPGSTELEVINFYQIIYFSSILFEFAFILFSHSLLRGGFVSCDGEKNVIWMLHGALLKLIDASEKNFNKFNLGI